MRALLMCWVLVGAAPETGRFDAGTRIDAGWAEDGGADGGVDAGRVVVASVKTFNGVTVFDGGFTDVVTLSLDASVELKFPRHVLATVCDAELVRIEASVGALVLTGHHLGSTQCGFWFDRGMPPGRYVAITVVP